MAQQVRRLAAIDPSLPAGQQRLAEALRSLRLRLTPGLGTFALIAEQAAKDCGREALSRATVSRYFSGKLVAPSWFISWLHDQAQLNSGAMQHVPGLEELLLLQREANEPTDCSRCNRLIRQLSSSEAELLTVRSRSWQLERILAARLDAAGPAGLTAGSRRRSSAQPWPLHPLPVPRRMEDRQKELSDIQAARAATDHIASLASKQDLHGQTAAVQNAIAALPPSGLAVIVVSLRGRQVRETAETLLQVCARELPARGVMELAASLLQRGLAADAEELLRSATR
ncbi:hypothetical protein AB0G35_29910 [Streptomyces sp. NPDC021749]|uniref:hypothetical protein n=1 Tax=Streptomyces sp. NPDC021749 TaxID=3154905 RepID=UPI003407FF01